MLDAINVIAQYARDQAVVSARDQAQYIATPYRSRRTHICLDRWIDALVAEDACLLMELVQSLSEMEQLTH